MDVNLEAVTHRLVRSLWNFGPADRSRHFGSMRFLPGGDIVGYVHPNEQRWEVKGNTLILQSSDGAVTSIFQLTDQDELLGHSLVDSQHHHLLSRVISKPPIRHDRQLLVEARLALRSRPLLVIFNSMGNPWHESAPIRWEYFHAANALDVDILRFAENQDPPCWYLNKTGQVMDWLRFATIGRSSALFAGNSSGGYAALRFAELIGSEKPSLPIQTIAINPQTVHGLRHRSHLMRGGDWNMLPPMISDQVLDNEGTSQDYDLDRVMEQSTGLVKHTIAYDSGNPAEAYYTSLISGFDHVRTHPLHLGMEHAPGIVHMEQAGLFASLAEPMLRADAMLER